MAVFVAKFGENRRVSKSGKMHIILPFESRISKEKTMKKTAFRCIKCRSVDLPSFTLLVTLLCLSLPSYTHSLPTTYCLLPTTYRCAQVQHQNSLDLFVCIFSSMRLRPTILACNYLSHRFHCTWPICHEPASGLLPSSLQLAAADSGAFMPFWHCSVDRRFLHRASCLASRRPLSNNQNAEC